MTDKQIIKALECCNDGYSPDCKNCPNEDTCEEIDVVDSIIDLINRQKAEIERLNAKIKTKDEINYYNIGQLKVAREELNKYPIKTIVSNNCEIRSKTSKDYDNLMADIKSEAINEFAERLKKYAVVNEASLDGEEIIDVDDIDNLVKEITKGANKNGR